MAKTKTVENQPGGRGHRLLIVEDEAVTRQSLRRYFERKGWTVLVAASVGEAFTMLAPLPDCIILDLMLPDKNGEILLWKIRSEKVPVRVVVVTGVLDPDRLAAVERLNPEAVYRKPFNLAEVYQACEPRPDDAQEAIHSGPEAESD